MISSKSKTSARASQTKSTRARRQKRQRRNLQLESLETRQLLAAGDIAIFHVGSFAGEDLAGGTDPGADIDSLPGPDFIHDFDPTAVRSSGAHILQANNQDIALEAGHHLVIYNTRFDKQPDFAGNENRSEIQTNLNLNGVDLAAGFAQGFDREFSDAREAIISGGSIIDVQSSGDLLKLKSFRTDADTNPSVRVNDNTGIQLLKLNDSDDFLILSGDTGPRSAGDQAVTTGFQAVDFGVSQEADMGSFGHSTSTNPGDITLKTAGHYLVFANTYGYGATSRVGMLQRLTLDGTRIDGSESYVYLRGNDVDQNTDEGAATIGMIVETSSANQILNVQVRGETDRTVRIDGARTAVTIVKLDDAGDYVRLVDTSNDQNINSTRDIDFDDAGSQVELDAAAFSHSISTNSSRIGVTQDDDYLFFASQYDTNGGATRGVYNQRWEKNDDGQPFQYGQTGAYNRNQGGQSDQLGNWSGLLVDLNGGEFIQATSRAVGVAGTNNANRLGLQGVRISTIFGRSPVIDNVTGDTTIYIPASGPQLLDQPGPGDALVTDDQADFNGGSLTVSFAAGGEATDALTIDNAAANNGSNAITVAAGTVSHNGLAIGTISGGGSGTPLVITFTSTDATPAAASDLIQSILYEDGGDAAANVNKDVEFALNDGVSAATIVTSNVSLARLLGPETLHVWDGNADSDGDGVSWNDPLNWVADIVPDANDVAVFNNTGSGFPAVDLGAAVRFIGGLALDAGGYTIENGTLLIVNSSATTGVLTQDAAVSGSTNSVAARINSPTLSAILNGGTLELTDTTNNIGPTGSFIVNEGSSLRAEVDLTSSALGEAEVTVNGPITPPVVSSDVNISIFQAATAGEVLTGGTNTNTPGPDFIQDFDTTVRADGAHTLQPGGQDIALDSGHHLVIYNSRFNKGAGGTEDRSQVQTNFNLDGTDLSTGWSNGFIRLQEGQNETITAGGAIIDVQNDGDLLQLQSFRTDTDTNATTRANGESAIQLVKLDDSWDYLSLSGNDGAGPDQIIPNSTSAFTAVNYTASQEADAGSFGHNTATNPADITLNTAGHYLVMANTYAYGASSRESILQRLTLDGAMVAGSQTSVYLRGNDINQLTDEGAASIGMIIETTGANQILNVEITQDVGRTGMSIDGDRTGLTIVKLPDGGDYIRLLDTSNNQNINSTRELNFDDAGSELEIDGSFTHSNPSQIAANASGDYLFFASQYDVDDGAARGFYNQRWEKNNGTPFAYGQTGRYSRSTGGADQFGNWSGLLVDLDGGDFVQATTRVLGNAGTNNANTLGLQGVSLTSFFTSQPEGLELFSTSGNPTVNLTNNVTATDRATILLTGITSASLGDLTTVGGAFLTVESNNGATLEFRGDAGSGVDISGTGDGVLGGVAETTINPTNDTTLALNNVDSNADVQIVGTGVVELSGPNVNNDATWFVEGGTLSVADDLGFGNNPSPVVDSGTLLLDGVDLPVGATIVLRGGTLTNDGDSSVDIVNLEADSEIDSTSGTLTISEINTIDDDPIVADAVPATVGYAVTFSGAAATIVTGAIGNSVALPAAAPGSVVQDGNGDVTLSGVSNYDGATSIVDGTLILLGPNGNLGDDFTGTTVTAGAALQLEGGVSVPTELISIFGTGDGAGNGALRNESGTNSVGNLDLAGDADIRVVADTLNIMGTVDLDNELTFRGAATANITAQVTGNGGDIIKFGSGVVALTNSANDFDGDIDVRDGTLRITSDGTLGNATGTTTVSDAGNQNTTLEFSGAFDYTDAETILFVGPGDNNGGALRNDNGDTTIGPNVALFTTGDATIFNAAANSIFTIDADVSSLFALTVDGSGDTVISGDVSTLDLSGVAPIVANYSDVIASLDNVEGYWEFEDAVTTDSSANNRNGTLTGSLATGNPVAGQVGDSIEFTTNTDHVVVTGYKGITGAAARSMAAWVRFEGTDNNQGIMHWGTNLTGQKWTFRVQDTDGQAGAIRVEVNGSAIVGNVDIRDGQWHHVAAVLEPGSVSAGSTIEDIRLYVDGQIDAGVRPGDPTPSAVVGNANLAINTASVNDVRIGLNESTSDWEGGIDEPAIFSDAITGGEIAAMHASGRFGGTSIIKNGAGQLTLSGTNTFLGETDVNEGVVIATNSSSLGSVLGGGGMELSAGTIVADGATLALDGSGGALLITESLALSGNGTTIDVDGDHADDITPAIGALVSFGGDNEVIGSITATGSEIGIGTADNVLTITSDVDLSFAKVAFSGGGDSVVNGDISGVGGFDYATQLLGLGPDAYWQFEDASGSTTATDSSPNGHDGDVAAPIAVSNPVAGIVGNAFDFDNTNNAITATGYQGVTGTAARTISAFVKVEGTDANQSFMHWGTNVGGQKWTFRIQDGNGSIDGNLRLEVNGGFITGTTDIRDGQWHHVAMVFDPGSVSGASEVEDIRLYVDGALDAGVGTGTPPNAITNRAINTASGNDVRIGLDEGTRDWEGLVDEAAIFARALSPSEVFALAQISPDNQLMKMGSGMLTLAGDNSYDGATTVMAGALNVQSNTALGTIDSGTTVAAGATLQLEGGGVNVTGEDLVLTAELGNPATLENVSGDNTWTGAINASTPVVGEIQIVSLTIGDTLTIDGDVDLRESKLSVDGDGDTLIAGDIFSTSPIPTSFAEIGQLTDVDGTMQTISFQNTYTNPVIVAMASQRDAGTANLADDPNAAVVRVSNVDPVGGTFDIRLQSPSSGSTGFPVQETVNYIVIEAGEYVLDTGAVLKADTAVVTGNANQTINFAGSAFGATPIAISQIVSENNAAFVKARHRAGVNTASFTLFLEEAAGQTQHAASETVGYIAIEPTVGTTAGFLFEAGTTTNSVTHAEFTVALANTYNSPPIFVADQQTIDGGDPGGSRFRYVGSDVTVFSDEDRSSDNETAHADEVFGYVAFDGTGIMRDGLVPDNQLMKMGDGTLILEGDNTYENGTAVLGGTLLANNTAGSATGTSNVQVDTAGTLGGTGTVAGAVNVDTGTIAPGNPTGTLSAANTTINATGTLDVEIGGNAAGLWDILAVTGGVNLNGPTLSASITNGFTTTPGEAFVIVSNDELEPITGEFAGLPEGGSLNLPGGGRFHITYIYDAGTGTEGNGNDIALIANNPPVAGQDGPMTIPEDVAINIAASGVLGNDSDSDAADTITAQLVTGPTNALSFTLNTDGSWNYTPNLHFSGADSFTYLATDGELDSNQITVDINILPVADAPSITLGASTITVPENSVIPLNIATALVDTDGSETLVTTLTGVPAIGTLSAGTESGGVYTLTSTQLVGLTLTMPDNLSADAAFTLTITATATEGVNNVAVSTDTIDITVNNVVPAASISGTTSTVPNFAVPYVVNVSDVGPTDQADGFDITIDWGDGTSDVFGPNSVGLINLNHSFAEFGNFDVTLTATDKDGGQTVYIHNVQVDPVAIIDRELFVGGTDAVNDRIIVQDAGRNSVYVRYNDIRYGSFDQTDFDVVRIFGGDGNDRVSVSGICLPAITELQEGRDAYFGGTCNDTVDGGSGRDIIQLGEGDNFADGGDDNDVITSRSGNDILRGGNGNDRLQPGAGDDIAFGDGGNDQIIGSRGNDLLVGGLGNDNLNGGDGHDVLVGGIGNDILRSGTGEDLAIGGVGNDGIRGDGGVDTITGAEGENEADEAALLSLLAGWTATRDRSAIGALLDDSDQDGLNGNGGADQIGIGVDDAVYSLRAADVLFSV